VDTLAQWVELVAEVKRTSKHKEAARLQLAYYLCYLKQEKGVKLEGILLFPKERKTEKVELTPELEEEVEAFVKQMMPILLAEEPPPAKKIRYCKSCSFNELCWG
jgi:CRISPR-associated exonuclease Cas4